MSDQFYEIKIKVIFKGNPNTIERAELKRILKLHLLDNGMATGANFILPKDFEKKITIVDVKI